VASPSTILVLGGPSAGKTVYLSVLYHHLWNGHHGTVMRAGDGVMHSELLHSVDSIREGKMPAATASLRHYEFELEHEQRTYLLRYLDYPGELFRRVFHDLMIDSDEARELHEYCEGATGVLVLVDPRSVVDHASEMDYSLSNLLRYYRSRGMNTPFVIGFTKRDENRTLVRDHLDSFVRQYLPHVARELDRGVHLMHFCSVIKSDHAVQVARPPAVKAPLESILQAVEQSQSDQARRRYMRRLAMRSTGGRVLLVIALAIVALLSFVGGVFLRHAVEMHR
jgi:hypothetical protein